MIILLTICLLLLGSARKAKELQVHSLNEVEVAVMGLVVDFFWVVLFDHFKLFPRIDKVTISVVMPAQKPILFTSKPSLPERKVGDVALRMQIKTNIVAIKHVVFELH